LKNLKNWGLFRVQLKYEDVMEILRIVDQCECEEINMQWNDFKLVVRKNVSNGISYPDASLLHDKDIEDDIGEDLVKDMNVDSKVLVLEENSDDRLHVIKAPMVGIFYRSPSPDQPPFVEVGNTVNENDTLCLIEVMKVFNTIKAPCKGRVVDIKVTNEEMVEYNQVLIAIEPLD